MKNAVSLNLLYAASVALGGYTLTQPLMETTAQASGCCYISTDCYVYGELYYCNRNVPCEYEPENTDAGMCATL
jgi:hypothetical protein